jgi:hypothetical protein
MASECLCGNNLRFERGAGIEGPGRLVGRYLGGEQDDQGELSMTRKQAEIKRVARELGRQGGLANTPAQLEQRRRTMGAILARKRQRRLALELDPAQ